jgi:hypothetical protein
MAVETFLLRTMSDTVETDIGRVYVIANEILPRYGLAPLSFEQLRKVADGPFDLFLIPLIFTKEYEKDRNLPFNEAKGRTAAKRSGPWLHPLAPVNHQDRYSDARWPALQASGNGESRHRRIL